MKLVGTLCALILVASCNGSIIGGTSDPEGEAAQDREDEIVDDDSGVALRTHLFEEVPGDVTNPERGFYVGVNLFKQSSITKVREQGSTLAIALIRLDDYRTSAISTAFLDDLAAGFQGAREHGFKVILRFMYNSSFTADASRAQIVAHIAQLTPLLQANADVIAVMQAGFIGAWGEWHGSTNGLDNFDDRQAVLDALLAALPENRAVQVRTPMFKRDLWNNPTPQPEGTSGMLPQGRVGHHNDCFLASDSDFGTFASPLSDWRAYLSSDTRFVPMGGETCTENAPRTDCAAAIADMEGFHWSYLNSQYKVEVLNGWEGQGCMDEVENRLGYRLVLDSVTHPETAKAGQQIKIEVALHNRGFAAPFNERPVYLVMRSETSTQLAKIDGIDPRRWLGGESNVHTLKVSLPKGMETGTYSVALWLPDADAGLAADPRFAVRFANDGTWQEAQGENILIPALFVGEPSGQGQGGDALLVAINN